MKCKTGPSHRNLRNFPLYGWIGLGMTVIFWCLNWTLDGVHSNWGFFPLWFGYCLSVDGLVYLRTGTSLLSRNWRKFAGLFLASVPVWWFFEAVNVRLQNWIYLGVDQFSRVQYWAWSSLSFSTVIPAVFISAELAASFDFVKRIKGGPVIVPDKKTTTVFFLTGWVMFVLLLVWPQKFFPFLWLSLYFIFEPINVWLGNRNLADWTKRRDWRPVVALWVGVLITAFFWEMWNYLSYPKWIYRVPWGQFWHIFEMPILGYIGYLPFALELFAVYHLMMGFFGEKDSNYVHVN